jgi:TrpR-related protein YerC/YecD
MYISKIKTRLLDQLFHIILSLKDQESCYRFFEDLCTVQELNDFSVRLEVAKLLNENKSYTDIMYRTKASSATISRVKKSLFYGAKGYQSVLRNLTNQANLEK